MPDIEKDIFISYSRKDTAIVKLIYERLDMTSYSERIEYDIKAINKEYGLNHPVRLFVMYYILKNDLLRRVYIRFKKIRLGTEQ